MRLTFLLIIGTLFVGFSYALAIDDNVLDNNNVIDLLKLADQGDAHANEGARESRAFCCGGYGRGGYGRGGYGFYGYRRGGYGYGGYGRGGYGRGGYGYGGYGRGGYRRGGYGRYGR